MEIITLEGGYDKNFTYLLIDAGGATIMDLGLPFADIQLVLGQRKLTTQAVFILHSHHDHIVDYPKWAGISLYGHESNPVVKEKLCEGQTLLIAGRTFTVFHTPGHRFDSICLFDGKHLFTSDTLFVDGCGRADLEGSDPEHLWHSLQKLKALPDEVIIYPGHNYGLSPTSTMGIQKRQNRFLQMDKEEFMRMR